uniref:Uncharacterized protein n=1 Tax=Clastoptera arizonana TaxID=38151 RepID=A0A1B6DS75_9HEMI
MSIPYAYLKNEEIPSRRPHSQELEVVNNEHGELNRKSSIFLPHLQGSEKTFFNLVSEGDIHAVQEFLSRLQTFNLNCTNFQGVSALHLAVQKNNEVMVDFLLSKKNMDVHDCALHATRNNQPKILSLILDRLKDKNPEFEFLPCVDSPEFPDNITPLMLAAQCGHYEIIHLLLERNHKINLPHRPHCFCPHECLTCNNLCYIDQN